MGVALLPVTRDNVHAVCGLRVAEYQQELVAPAAVTVAEAHYHEGVLRAIARDGELAGLAWVVLDEETPFLMRFMVGEAHQRTGIGRAAMALLEDELRAADVRELEVSFVPAENGAAGFWERCGFADTGRVRAGERVFRKDL